MKHGFLAIVTAGVALSLSMSCHVQAAEKIEYDFLIEKPQEKILEIKSGKYVCGAGFVKAEQSNQLTNSDDLEFWCRDSSEPLNLDFKSLPKFNQAESKSNIINIDGKIVDMFQGVVWDNDRWTPIDEYFKLPLSEVRNYTGQYFVGDGIKRFGFKCSGRSIVDKDGNYYGSIKDATYVTVINGKVYANKDGSVLVGRGLKKKAFCGQIDVKEDVADVGAIYGLFPYKDELVTGGSFRSDDSPAALYFIKENGVRKEVLDREIATEVYTYTVLNDDLYIGLYPSGEVLRLHEDNTFDVLKDYFPAGHNFEEGPYREIQSLVFSGGYLFAGVYPRGKFMYYDSLTERKGAKRLFSFPEENAQYIPFSNESKERIENFKLGKYDGIKVDDSEISSHETEVPRRWGLFESAWGQRISHIALFSGKICVSTGSMGNSAYVPQIHDFLSKEQYEEYGRIYCVDRDRHLMTHVDQYPVKAKFVIGEDFMKMEVGDRVYTINTSSNADMLRLLGR